MKRDQGPPEERVGSRSARFLRKAPFATKQIGNAGIGSMALPEKGGRPAFCQNDNPPEQTDGPEGDRPPSGVPESPDHTLAFNLPARVFLGRKGKCEPAHTSIEKISLRSKSEAATGGDLASNRRRGTMHARNRILICAALATRFMIQGSS